MNTRVSGLTDLSRSHMEKNACLALVATPVQVNLLKELQAQFAQVCNTLAPEVSRSRVWGRVALHHLHYKRLRAEFPRLGSQMVCNVIYAVSKAARLVFQHPSSPLHVSRLGPGGLPLLRFAANGPVYFDRHTLSLREDGLSLYTLEGRIRFEAALQPETRSALQGVRLLEVVLESREEDRFTLTFKWDAAEQGHGAEPGREEAVTDPDLNPLFSQPEHERGLAWSALWPPHVSIDQQGAERP